MSVYATLPSCRCAVRAGGRGGEGGRSLFEGAALVLGGGFVVQQRLARARPHALAPVLAQVPPSPGNCSKSLLRCEAPLGAWTRYAPAMPRRSPKTYCLYRSCCFPVSRGTEAVADAAVLLQPKVQRNGCEAGARGGRGIGAWAESSLCLAFRLHSNTAG